MKRFAALTFSLSLTLGAAALSAQDEPPAIDPTAPVPGDPANDVVDRLQAAFDATADFQAAFTQESVNVMLGDTRTSAGTVYFLRPGMMVWDYDDSRRLVLDGTSFHSVDHNARNYFSAPVEGQLPAAARFLLGQGRLLDEFAIVGSSPTDDGAMTLELTPREPMTGCSALAVVVDDETSRIREVTIVDELGNANTLRFDGWVLNQGMQASAFQFAPPTGYTRLEVPE